jgi:hypothetical protein
MSLDFLPVVLGIYLLILVAFIIWESFVMADEKKKRQREGITDYYDNPIEKNDRAD